MYLSGVKLTIYVDKCNYNQIYQNDIMIFITSINQKMQKPRWALTLCSVKYNIAGLTLTQNKYFNDVPETNNS